MKYAIISDIHGNEPALKAVLEDAKSRNVDGYIVVGDYCLSNPFPNESISAIRQLTNAYVIRGNEESYLENLIGKDQTTWTDGQMQISYWCYRNVSEENLNYLLNLPRRIDVSINNIPVHITHSSADFIEHFEHGEWNAATTADRYREKAVTRSKIREDIQNYYNGNDDFQIFLKSMDSGIYIFGHSHIQWSYVSEDKKVILINPGSCGLPLDCINEGIPYTIVDLSDSENVSVEEIRVLVDKNEYIDNILQSRQYLYANVWSKVIKKELKTSREHLTFFLRFVEDYATQIGDKQRPYSVETWEKAYELWNEQSEGIKYENNRNRENDIKTVDN